MAFENSSATDPTDLIQKLHTFLASNGWTSDSSAADGSGWRVHMHKGSQFVHMRAQMNEPIPWQGTSTANKYSIGLYLGTAFSGGSAWNAQTTGAPTQSADSSKPVGVGMRLAAGAIPNYYFFTDSSNENVAVVVEIVSGVFVHMGWGLVDKIGSFTGGDYFFSCWDGSLTHSTQTTLPGNAVDTSANCPGICNDPFSSPSTFVRADVDSFTGKWIGIAKANTVDVQGYTGKNGTSPINGAGNAQSSPLTTIPSYSVTYGGPADFQSAQTSALDGRANLLPVVLYAQRDGSGPGYSPVGTLPIVRSANGVGEGFSPASSYPIGSDTYIMFPEFAVLQNL